MVCSLSSLLGKPPPPRCLPTASISSINMMHGWFSRATWKSSRARFAPTPTNISTKFAVEHWMKGTFDSPAIARAKRDFPVPGAPARRAPRGIPHCLEEWKKKVKIRVPRSCFMNEDKQLAVRVHVRALYVWLYSTVRVQYMNYTCTFIKYLTYKLDYNYCMYESSEVRKYGSTEVRKYESTFVPSYVYVQLCVDQITRTCTKRLSSNPSGQI